jgi:predicted nucleotide-binding protein (sugar kinase/HSP70/actin superfamily)
MMEPSPAELPRPEVLLQDIAELPRRPAAGGEPVPAPAPAPKELVKDEQVVSREVLEHLEDAIEILQTEKQKAVQSEREKLEAIKQEIKEYSEVCGYSKERQHTVLVPALSI